MIVNFLRVYCGYRKFLEFGEIYIWVWDYGEDGYMVFLQVFLGNILLFE